MGNGKFRIVKVHGNGKIPWKIQNPMDNRTSTIQCLVLSAVCDADLGNLCNQDYTMMNKFRFFSIF